MQYLRGETIVLFLAALKPDGSPAEAADLSVIEGVTAVLAPRSLRPGGGVVAVEVTEVLDPAPGYQLRAQTGAETAIGGHNLVASIEYGGGRVEKIVQPVAVRNA